jgi:GT2 family glycosyltransferase
MSTVKGPIKTLTVQSVLYHHGPDEVARMVTGIANSVRAAKRFDLVGPVNIIIGDSSRTPMLSDDQIDRLRDGVEPWGVTGIDYEFFETNLGSAGGHNRLFERNRSDYVLILNPDTFASPFMLAELGVSHGDASVGITEPRQIPLEHPKTYDLRTGDTSWASGAGCLVKRKVIDATGGFDAASFFLYCDDVDFSWRTRLAGFRVVLQPTARLFHDKRLTTDGTYQSGDVELFYQAEGTLMLAWKYSRPDLVEQWLEMFSASPIEQWVRAAAAFDNRRKMGRVPDPIDPDGRVAQFIGMSFGGHRYLWSD